MWDVRSASPADRMNYGSLLKLLTLRGTNVLLAGVGLELVRRGKMSTEGLLARAAAQGLDVRTVIDVGAAFGDSSESCSRAFPQARYVLVEPLEEYELFLRRQASALPHATYVRAAAAETGGTLTLHVHTDLVGTSRFVEVGEDLETSSREVRSVTVDNLRAEFDLKPPYLLKVDVQGGELLVLEGARSVLADAALVILEVSFFPFFDGGATFPDVVAWTREHGLAVYDVTNPLYRPIDNALAQVDLCCVPEGSSLRRTVAFATADQRRANDASFSAKLRLRRKRLRT